MATEYWVLTGSLAVFIFTAWVALMARRDVGECKAILRDAENVLRLNQQVKARVDAALERISQ